MSNEDVIAIQQQLVAKERAKRIAHEAAMKRDIRSQMARSGWYQPEGDVPNPEYREYPKLLYLGKDREHRFVVNNREEENAALGKTDAPAREATVDLNELAAIAPQVNVETKRRGRPPKAKLSDLPQNLE